MTPLIIIVLFTVLPPTLNLSLDTGTQQAAFAGTRVSLLGMVNFDSVVDSQVTVSTSWTRQDSSGLLSLNESVNPPYITALNFETLSIRDAGDYVFLVDVTPLNPTSVRATPSVSANYTINVEPYPDINIVIMRRVRSEQCMENEIVVLNGEVSLLHETTTNHIIGYTWTAPNGHITDQTGNGGMIVVGNLSANSGYYNLTVCLTIPGIDFQNNCSTVDYYISTDGKCINQGFTV